MYINLVLTVKSIRMYMFGRPNLYLKWRFHLGAHDVFFWRWDDAALIAALCQVETPLIYRR